MATITITAEINEKDLPFFEILFEKFKAKVIKKEEEGKDPAKFTKEEYFKMIDEARKSESIEMSMEEMQKILLMG